MIESMLLYKISDDLSSKFFGSTRKLISNIKGRMTNEDHRDYKPDYLFSLEILINLINNMKRILGIKKAYTCIKLIRKYWDTNRDLKSNIVDFVTDECDISPMR